MTEAQDHRLPEAQSAAVLPKNRSRMDWFLLPFLGAMTIFLLSAASEVSAAHLFARTPPAGLNTCVVHIESYRMVRLPANSVCWEKVAEGPVTEYRTNACGDRTMLDCHTKPASAFRIGMVGSSMATGRGVPAAKTFAVLLPRALSRDTGRNIELYNAGLMQAYLPYIDLTTASTLKTKPDMILWAVTPLDIAAVATTPAAQPKEATRSAGETLREAFSSAPLDYLRTHFDRTYSATMLRDLLYQSQALYVKSFLLGGDSTEFLRSTTTPAMEKRLQQFARVDADVQAQANAAHIPLAVTYIPDRAQVAMISLGEWPAGIDPFRLDNQLRSVVEANGGTYVSVLHDFRSIPHPERGFYAIDGHLNANGEAMMTSLLAKGLEASAIPGMTYR